ncbi:manganese efflux pump [Aneurinibacillus sp. Ricciae_BoGa-3]|uniref:manganese efflux pump MntP n=1 Tax=Aneurinibacillus sp. Ricciae_BoGa-3 TaxID=3022697 RepID=UPI00234111CD|nr:manganese efflux pump [Aneurinibacillus sp. Ricciae_BoGa-3]WCK56346.1 manganese efflux pump [Aneurinibacillus sp. Ricciae_BoGa-3]
MNWLNAFIIANLIGIGSNLDNTSVGIAYGIQKIKFPHRINMVINLLGACTALLGAYMGEVISHYTSLNTAQFVSCAVLCGIGSFTLYSAYLHPLIYKRTSKVELHRPGIKQGVLLGIGLSFTNVASGFSATIANSATLWTTVISIAAWGYIMIFLGNIIGIGIVSKLFGKYSSLAAGFLLIGVGVHQIM